MPATLSLSLGTAASFGAFTPGTTRDYEASATANVVSTAGDAALSVADPATANAGHLVNGAFFAAAEAAGERDVALRHRRRVRPAGRLADDAGQLRRAGQQRPGDAAVQAAGRCQLTRCGRARTARP